MEVVTVDKDGSIMGVTAVHLFVSKVFYQAVLVNHSKPNGRGRQICECSNALLIAYRFRRLAL